MHQPFAFLKLRIVTRALAKVLPALDDPLDIESMTRDQRDALKRELLRQHPELVERYMGSRADQ